MSSPRRPVGTCAPSQGTRPERSEAVGRRPALWWRRAFGPRWGPSWSQAEGQDRWITSVLAMDGDEREKLLRWVPVIKATIEKVSGRLRGLRPSWWEASASPKSLPPGPLTKQARGEGAS